MAEPISIQQLKDASLDVKSLEEVVNGNENVVVTTRLGETYPSVKGSIKKVFEVGGLPATPFKTKALMTASSLANDKYAQVTDDTVNNGLYVKTAGNWVKSAYDPAVLANTYTDNKVKGVTNNFKTKVLMTASSLPNDSYAMVTDDAENNGLYVKTSGAWVKSGYDPISASIFKRELRAEHKGKFFNNEVDASLVSYAYSDVAVVDMTAVRISNKHPTELSFLLLNSNDPDNFSSLYSEAWWHKGLSSRVFSTSSMCSMLLVRREDGTPVTEDDIDSVVAEYTVGVATKSDIFDLSKRVFSVGFSSPSGLVFKYGYGNNSSVPVRTASVVHTASASIGSGVSLRIHNSDPDNIWVLPLPSKGYDFYSMSNISQWWHKKEIVDAEFDDSRGDSYRILIRRADGGAVTQEDINKVTIEIKNDPINKNDIMSIESNIHGRFDNAVSRVTILDNPYRTPSLASGGNVVFIDDDGKSVVYSELYPFFKNLGVPFGEAISPLKLGTDGYMTYMQLKEIYNDSNILEVQDHSLTHANLGGTTLSIEEKEVLVREAKKWFTANGYDVTSFVLPYGGDNKQSIDMIQKYYTSCYDYASGTGLETFDTIKNRKIDRSTWYSSDNSLQKHKNLVDAVATNGGLLTICLHVRSDAYWSESTFDELEELVAYIRSKGVGILKPYEAFKIYGNIVENDNGFKIQANGKIVGAS